METFTVYALVSEKDRRIYVGMTANLDRRIHEHNAGQVRSTQGYRPWQLLYTESASDRVNARIREKYLKSGVGKEFLKGVRDNTLPG